MASPSDNFTEAVDTHYPRVYRLARIMSGNDQDASDLTQETFLAALQNVASFRGQATMSTWLIGILRRRFLNTLRRRQASELPDEFPAAEEAIAEPGPDIHAAMATLSEPVRTALFLFYFENLDYAAIADVLDCPISTVRSRLHFGREQLRKQLAPAMREALR